MPVPTAIAFRPRPAAVRRTLLLFGITAVFCVLVAALLTLVRPTMGSFSRNLLFSESIGLWLTAVATLVRRLPGVRSLPDRAATLLSLGVAIPLGYVLGYVTAGTLLGEPVRIVGLSDSRIAAVVATVLAGGFGAYLTWLHSRLSAEAAARATAQKLAVEAELRMLRAQLEPHMLFNTLANLRSLVDDDPSQAKHMIDLLITYLRGALAGSRTDTTTLRAEFAQLAAYLEILTLRLGKRLRYELDLPEDLQQAAVPSMLLQPLVENAIKHGIEPKIGGGTVSVSALRGDAGLELRVRDTGLGLPSDEAGNPVVDGDSYGLMHVHDRLRALYGGRASLQLERQQPAGTLATVRIPA